MTSRRSESTYSSPKHPGLVRCEGRPAELHAPSQGSPSLVFATLLYFASAEFSASAPYVASAASFISEMHFTSA
ncbi:hypothetical protein CALCODRAFT_493840, partial [Calocera cornea HHB12733]